MTTALRPTAFALVGLQLLDVGPLRGSTAISFRDEEGRPTNLFLIMGPNGGGKTTILDSIYRIMLLLQAQEHPTYGMDALDEQGGGLQLDARIVLDDGSRGRTFLLSIVAGTPGLLKPWTPDELASLGAEQQIILQYERRGANGSVTRAATSSETAIAFADAILERLGDPPLDLFESANNYPTVLYFPSNRGIRSPPLADAGITPPPGLTYRPAHLFDTDGATWAESLDNLFVWFRWLDDGREERCRELVNHLVFRERKRLGAVDRQRLFIPVEVEQHRHRLHQLSSGERQLVQLVVRIASHMTRSTIVLIDESEQHLHLVMRRRLLKILKDWARDYDGLSFVLTSHQAESFRLLGPKRREEGLFKSGSLLKPRYNARP